MDGEKLYICRECGKPTPNFTKWMMDYMPRLTGTAGYSICDECLDKRVAFSRWQNEQYDTDELVCPWCGYKDPDSWELGDEDDAYECPNCGRVFEYSSEVARTFTSRKRKQDYPGDDAQ